MNSAALAVLGDAREERGLGRVPLWLAAARANARAANDAAADANAYADADAAANADANAYADADADAYDAYADAYDAYAYADDAYAYADDDDDDEQPTSREKHMRNGLYAVTVAQSGRAILRVGWFRRDPSDPDEYETAWVTPYRGEYTTRLGDVWAQGPKAAPNWTWGPVVESVCHRFHFQPLARLDAAKWAKVCPKPEGWES